MSRWTQFEEDAFRLPEGMKRIAYDADTKMYTFRDRLGALYQGPPGEDYGILTPVAKTGVNSRPGAFESDKPPRKSLTVNPDAAPSSFHDILPANLITSPSSSIDGKSPPSPILPGSPKEGDRLHHHVQFKDAVRKVAMPKMQGMVHNLRRSITSVRRKPTTTEERENLLHGGAANLNRSASVATTHSGVSNETPVLDNPRRHH
ncbi:hypothetical protein Hypma_001391 [Hypsizygus marmoreus]|uniref:Uncharacterized protein n=1 Tax=Hypsizygus marmoreus TaxID=39966 RepID=A0A369K5T4_HYPMA|nr:hypothetical protein Hypma_001391 [Hypsizygus marmoreus]